ncbi:Uncharacterized protein OBRU01_16660 [Operophtera brumata]|uniref:MTOR-associated protein MEAK7 n=1 Tax=Operophtera brumata TaxID=104452 RepID=A0A0L7L1Y8_OPEBR|nr:Uncharacterized protein OBRU01_16660 [Operophtera brumata]
MSRSKYLKSSVDSYSKFNKFRIKGILFKGDFGNNPFKFKWLQKVQTSVHQGCATVACGLWLKSRKWRKIDDVGPRTLETVYVVSELLRKHSIDVHQDGQVVSSLRVKTWLSKGFKGRACHVQGLGETLAASVGDPDSPQNHCTSAQLSSCSLRVKTWLSKGFKGRACHVQGLGETLAASVGDPDSPQNHCTSAQLSSCSLRVKTWLSKGFKGRACHVQGLGETLAASVGDPDSPQNHCTSAQLSSCLRVKTWLSKGFKGRACHVQGLGETLAASVGDPDSPQNHCTSAQLSSWLQHNTLLKLLAEFVFVNLYGIYHKHGESPTSPHASMPSATPSLLPAPVGLEAMPDYPAFIDLAHIVWLNSHVPQDNNGYIFGGYAPASWALGPNFSGSEDSFLFTLAPKLRVYPATSFNNHYQYMNHHTKTLPNGLLMGGQFEFGGIWVNADPFGEGSSAESCSTYRGYKRLSKEPTFRIKSLEVWGVGDKPLTLKDSTASITSRSSVLDSKKSDRGFMKIIGKQPISDGLRD